MAVYVRRRISFKAFLIIAISLFVVFQGLSIGKKVYYSMRKGLVMGAQSASLPLRIDTFYEASNRCNSDGSFSAVYYLRIASGFPGTPAVSSAEYTVKFYVPWNIVRFLQLPPELTVTSDGVIVGIGKLGPNDTATYTFRVVIPENKLSEVTDFSVKARLDISEGGYFDGKRFEAVSTIVRACDAIDTSIRDLGEEPSASFSDEDLTNNFTEEVGISEQEEGYQNSQGLSSNSGNFREILRAPATKICACYNRQPTFSCQEYKNVDIDVRCETYCKARDYGFGESVRCKDLEVIYSGL